MSDDDDVRRALSAYAATTPDLDPGAGLRERLVRRDRVRRATVAGVACFAAVVAGTGVAVLSRDRGTAGVVAAGDLPSETPASEEPTPTPEPTESPTAEPPGPTATAAAPTAPPPESTPPSPRPPGEPVSRTEEGEHGLRVQVTVDHGSLPTATQATVTVRATDDDGDPHVRAVSWDDGSEEAIAILASACVSPYRGPTLTPAPSRTPSPGKLEQSFRHAWRHDGHYTVRVRVYSNLPCVDGEEPEDVVVEVPVEVTRGEATSNGPARPVAHEPDASPAENGELYEYRVGAYLFDGDGWLSGATVDWGDGSAPTVLRNTDNPCEDGDGRYYPSNGFDGSATHRYSPGTYTAVVTFTSTGCAGGDVQRGRTEIRVEVESVD